MTAQPAIDLDTLVRSVLFLSAFLAAWISFRPFPDLSIPPLAVVEGGDLYNQIGYSTMFLAFAAWTYCHEPTASALAAAGFDRDGAVVRRQRCHFLGASAGGAAPRL